MRVPVGTAQVDAFHEICANLEMRPSDRPCAMTETRAGAAQIGSWLFTWLAVVAKRHAARGERAAEVAKDVASPTIACAGFPPPQNVGYAGL